MGRLDYFCGCLAMIFFCLLIWATYHDITATKYEIRKDQFSCTQTRQEIQYMTQQIGTQVTMVPFVVTVCDQYTRKG